MRDSQFAARLLALALFAPAAGPALSPAAEPAPAPKPKPAAGKHPETVSPADDPATALKKFSVAPGLKVEVFAAEPFIQNVVSFAFDERGRAYVVESGRRRTSVYDIRRHHTWTDADLSFRTVEDRANFLKGKLAPDNRELPNDIKVDLNGDGLFDWRDLEVETERVRLLWDSTGDGVADRVTTFADGFNTLVSGVAAGVLARKGDVYFACIPDLWLLRDTTGDGVADFRKSLHHGFGVHIAYGGHDLHGLKFGPDGKLYFSVADRGFGPPPGLASFGFSAESLARLLPDTGAVFRCNPDGSELEVVAVGLRNPQELAFDQFGNLFTGDNNADGGDKARWTHIVEGADFGWRYGWQHLPRLGAWNSEMLWGLAPSNTAAYILPPVAHIGHGPAGIAFYPGTGMPDRYKDHFFYADFPGGIRHFKVEPRGASFTVENPGDYLQDNSPARLDGKLVWGLYPTDIDFAPGGGAYVLDWVYGWEKTGKGRLYRVADPDVLKSLDVAQTKILLAEGMAKRSVRDLAGLLGHPDQRIRQEAQFELAARGRDAISTLERTARTSTQQLARLHAIWALGQVNELLRGQQPRTSPLAPLVPLLADPEVEVRAQAAKVLGDQRHAPAGAGLVKLLQDPSPRVRYFAAVGLGKLGRKDAAPQLLAMVRANADQDAYLRHAAVLALAAWKDEDLLFSTAKDPDRSIRLASLLALRKAGRPQIAVFLHDPDPALVLEAARAINDEPIEKAFSQLATLAASLGQASSPSGAGTMPAPLSEPVLRRAINANFRLGKIEHASALVSLAENADAPEFARVEALDALGDWIAPSGRDRIVGLWRPLPAREARAAMIPLRISFRNIIARGTGAVRIAAARTAARLDLFDAGPTLFDLVTNKELDPAVRVAAIEALGALKDHRLAEAIKLARADPAEALRKAAGRLLGQRDPTDAVHALAETLDKGTRGEQQAALQTLGRLKVKEADALLRQWLDRLLAGTVPPELHLDLLEAAGRRTSPSVREKLAAYEQTRPKDDRLGAWRETLHGGDARLGRELFFERADAGCFRCHKVAGQGGEVGPDLTGIGRRQSRQEILDSILFPNHKIAPGYENTIVTLQDGGQLAGMLKGETDTVLELLSPEDGLIKIPKADVQARARGLSSMPEEIANVISKADLRNLIEFLATQ